MILLWTSIILFIFIFQAATILLLEFRRPAHATAWLFILFLFPVVGFILYYFLAQEWRRRRTTRRRGSLDQKRHKELLAKSSIISSATDLPAPDFQLQERLFRSLIKGGALPISGRNHTEIYNNGEETYSSMLKAIREAKHHVHMATYILRDDATGRIFQKALIEKAKAGVQVRLLYDGIGSIKLNENYLRILQDGGVCHACFFPLRPAFMKKRMNYRNHRKILVVDGLKGFIGGINVGDEYIGKNQRLGYWRDTHMMIQGDAVYRLQEVFLKDWELATGEKLDSPQYFPQHECAGEEPVQIVPAGPNRRGDTIHDAVYAMMSAAKERIWLTTPYFIPSASVAMALQDAAMSGLDVRIIVPYVPDAWIVHYATLSYVEEMMSAGVRVWQYKRGFIHAKTLIVDSLVGVMGSANMDLRSFFSNFEVNAHLYDPKAIRRLEKDFLQDLNDSVEINRKQFSRRARKQKVKEAMARLLSPLM
jgi:cardiolipin synthase A/B